MPTLSICYSYSKHPTDTHFGVSVFCAHDLERAARLSMTFVHSEEGNTEYILTPKMLIHRCALSVSLFHSSSPFHSITQFGPFIYLARHLLLRHDSGISSSLQIQIQTQTTKRHHNRTIPFYIYTSHQMPPWWFCFCFCFSQMLNICLCV